MSDESLLDSIRTDFILNILTYAKTLLPEGIKPLDKDLYLTDGPINHSDAPHLENVSLNKHVSQSNEGIKKYREQLERMSSEDDSLLCDLQKSSSTSQSPTSNLKVNTKSKRKNGSQKSHQKSTDSSLASFISSVSSTTIKEPTSSEAEFSNFPPFLTSTVTEFSSFLPESANTYTVPSSLSPAVTAIPCESISTPQTLITTSSSVEITPLTLYSPVSNSTEAEFPRVTEVSSANAEAEFQSVTEVSSANKEAEFASISSTFDNTATISNSLSSVVTAIPCESISMSSSIITSSAVEATPLTLCNPVSNNTEIEFPSITKVSSAYTEVECASISPTLEDPAAVSSSVSPSETAIPCESITISSSSINLPRELPITLGVSDSIPQTLTIMPTAVYNPQGVFPVMPSESCSIPQIMTKMPPALDNTTFHSSVSDDKFTGTNRESCLPSEPPAAVLQTPIIETDEAANIPSTSESNLKQSETVGRKENLSIPDYLESIVENIEENCVGFRLQYAKKAAMVNILEMNKLALSPSFFKENEDSLLDLIADLKYLFNDMTAFKSYSDKTCTVLKDYLCNTPSQLGLYCHLGTRYKLCSILLDILLRFCREKHEILCQLCKNFKLNMMKTTTNSKTS